MYKMPEEGDLSSLSLSLSLSTLLSAHPGEREKECQFQTLLVSPQWLRFRQPFQILLARPDKKGQEESQVAAPQDSVQKQRTQVISQPRDGGAAGLTYLLRD